MKSSPALLPRAVIAGLFFFGCAPRDLVRDAIPDSDTTTDSTVLTDVTAPSKDSAVVTPDAPSGDAAVDFDTYVDVPVVIDPDAPPPPDAPRGDAPTGADARPTDAPVAMGDAGALPNLIPVISNPQIQERSFAMGACEVMEGCTMPGNRRLLRFDLTTPNIGRADLYLGSPTAAGHPPGRFEFGTCHGHYHLRGYADYRLVDMAGREVARGHKQSFCLLDSGRYMGMGTDLPASARYNCGNQGIHAGWMDIYGRGLDCQYVDITGVPPGRYRIRAQINIERVVAESSYDDNESFFTIDIPSETPGADGGVSRDPTLACTSATEGLRRDCGWMVEGEPRSCTPGARVAVGCNQGCMPAIGSCAGDPMIRICPGTAPCPDLTAIASNDDSCAPADGGATRLCSSLTFTCPSSGRYTILTGGYRAGTAYECHLETR